EHRLARLEKVLQLRGDASKQIGELRPAVVDHRAGERGGDLWGNGRGAWDAKILFRSFQLFHAGVASRLNASEAPWAPSSRLRPPSSQLILACACRCAVAPAHIPV